jgi:mevalonate kinase
MIKTSAPGSMIMFGEHSVLRGKHSIVLAIEQRLYVTLKPTSNREISINSPIGSYVTTLDQLNVQAPFQYVLQVLQDFPPETGIDIEITSEMSSTMGFGTSAAVVVSLLAGLMKLSEKEEDDDKLFANAISIVRKVQGMGSGADIMASIKGGIGLYQAEPLLYQPLSTSVEIFAVYSGSKTPTNEVVKHVKKRFLEYPRILKSIDDANDALTLEASKRLSDPICIGELFNISAGIMEAYGVHTKELSDFLWEIRKQSCGVKFSGSGLGDCAIGVVKDNNPPKNSFPIVISQQGLKVEIF